MVILEKVSLKVTGKSQKVNVPYVIVNYRHQENPLKLLLIQDL